MSHLNKNKQLGMPFGTASHKLRTKIMFMLVQECGRDTCFKCGNKIGFSDELSIEHKTPWLNNSPELFWDLDNIAFSHRKCNKKETFKSPKNKKICPEGMNWCAGHKDFLSIDKFGKEKGRQNSLRHYCKECRSIQNKKRYL